MSYLNLDGEHFGAGVVSSQVFAQHPTPRTSAMQIGLRVPSTAADARDFIGNLIFGGFLKAPILDLGSFLEISAFL